MKKIVNLNILSLLIVLFVLNSCSVNRIAVRLATDALINSGKSTVFTGDDDPEFIADALPFALKMYESLLQLDPRNVGLLETISSGYTSYANAFLQSPAELMGEYDQRVKKEKLLKRAAGLYRRGSMYASAALDVLYPDFSEKMKNGDWNAAFKNVKEKDISLLYWKAAAVLGEFSIDSFNPELMLSVPEGIAYLAEAFSLDPDFNRGALHDLLLSVFASMPNSLIYRSDDQEREFSVHRIFEIYYRSREKDFNSLSNEEKAWFHFSRSVSLSAGVKVAPFVSYAGSVCVKNQDYAQFKELLEKALEIDTGKDSTDRLINIIGQRKARWYLSHSDDYFILP